MVIKYPSDDDIKRHAQYNYLD